MREKEGRYRSASAQATIREQVIDYLKKEHDTQMQPLPRPKQFNYKFGGQSYFSYQAGIDIVICYEKPLIDDKSATFR